LATGAPEFVALEKDTDEPDLKVAPLANVMVPDSTEILFAV